MCFVERINQQTNSKTVKGHGHILKENTSGKKGKSLCDQVVDYVLQCGLEELRNISLTKLNKKFEISKVYLIKCFKKFICDTPGKFIFREKMERAKAMMQSSDKTTAEISVILGYSSASYFVRVFRKHFGKPPRQYLRIRAHQAQDYCRETPAGNQQHSAQLIKEKRS